MAHRGNTSKTLQLFRDTHSLANRLGHKEVSIDDLTTSLLIDLSLPGAQIIMKAYSGSDLLGMAREIGSISNIEQGISEIRSYPNLVLPHSAMLQDAIRRVFDFSRKLHHDCYASVHFPYAIINCLNNFPTIKGEGDRVKEVFRNEGRKWNSGLTSIEYMEAATTRWLMDEGLPVYGNVCVGVVGKDLFSYES